MYDTKLPRLGRGLESLFPKTSLSQGRAISYIPINQIRPNSFQPRATFKEAALISLSESIRQHGLNQPILVRRKEEGYEIIAGERRFRACQMANLDVLPAIIKDVDDKDALKIALIENLEREDLNPIEVAKGYTRLMTEFQMTHLALSEMFGRSRSAITNALRLLHLPSSVQKSLEAGDITEGHARTLLALEQEDKILEYYHLILQKKITVRQLEKLVTRVKEPVSQRASSKRFFDEFEKELYTHLDSVVRIRGKVSKGKIEIYFDSKEKFQSMMAKLRSI